MDIIKKGQTYRYCDICGKHHIEFKMSIGDFEVYRRSMGSDFDMFGNPVDFHMETHACSTKCGAKAQQLLIERWNRFKKIIQSRGIDILWKVSNVRRV